MRTLAPSFSIYGFAEFGAAVAVAGAYLVVGAPDTYYNGTDAGAVYVYNLNSGALLHTYYSPIYTTGEEFGSAVAASGSYAVVGAPGQSGTGAAYLIDLATGAITLVPAPVPSSDRSFGASVAISGSFFAVGDPQAYISSEPVGTVFTFTTVTGDLLHIFQSPSSEPSQEFGNALSMSGTTLVIGAVGTTVGENFSSGGVYVENLIYNTLQENLSNPNTYPFAEFGASVAVESGGAIVVGADGVTTDVNVPTQITTGVAYVFSTTAGDLVQSELVPTTLVQQAGTGFGASVAVLGTSVVVGDPGANASGQRGAGLGYLFAEVPLTVTSPYATGGGSFGLSVGLSDGIAVVGAPEENTPGVNASNDLGAGNAYLVSTSTLGLTLLGNPDPSMGGSFGYSVAIQGGSVVVGAPQTNESSGPDLPVGQAYLFNTSTGALEHTFDSKYPTLSNKASANGEFGESVAISSTWIAIGAPFEARSSNGSGPALGNVYVYYASNDSLASIDTMPGGTNNSSFGTSLAIDGNWILVGAPDTVNYNLNANVSGSVYVFDAGNGTLVANISNPYPEFGAAFGTSVAALGGTVVVGAPGENVTQVGSGAVYVFSLASRGGPVSVRLDMSLSSPDPTTAGAFGWAVAYDGGEIAVGAPDDNGDPSIPLVQAGSVYLFSSSNGSLLDRYGDPAPLTYNNFGFAVAIGPSRVVVGAAGQYPAGAADIFCWGTLL